jgi:peptide deformylase
MAIREILTVPDPRLKTVSDPVDAVTDELRVMMDDMLETMYDAPGIGLAAIQIAEPVRVLVIDLMDDGVKNPLFFINPEILWISDDMRPYEEGCLSVPELYEDLERANEVKVRFLDYDGNPQEATYEGMMSTCLQHEMDHLDGILFIDYLSRLKRQMIVKKLKKAKEQAND